MHGHGHHVRARVAAADQFAAVDAAVAKLETQLHKLKSRLVRPSTTGKGHVPAAPGAGAPTTTAAEEPRRGWSRPSASR